MYNCLKISILALLFLSCREDNEHRESCLMIFSDALPVQFWLSECNTYNQQISDGVHHKCFCQPWNCDDEIRIQFTDNNSGNTEAIILPALSLWQTTTDDPGEPDWSVGASPDVNLDNEESETLWVNYSFVEGRNYTITVDYTKVVNVLVSNPRQIRILIMDNLFNTLYDDVDSTPTTSSSDSFTISFTGLADMTKLGIRFADGSDVTLTVDDVTGTGSTGDDYLLSIRDESGNELLQLPFDNFDNGNAFVYNLSFIPSETSPDLCDQKVNFVIINETTGTERAQSDCQDIQTSHKNTVLVNYRNHRNIFGLIYADISPDISFDIRLPAIFYHQKFPKEEETMPLSTSLVSLNSTVRRQRFLEVDYVPYYFHEKIQLILVHQFVNIYNREWVTQEEYEVVEGDRRWPVKKGKCWISEKDFVQRNVL